MIFFKKNSSSLSSQSVRLNGITRANNRLMHMQNMKQQQMSLSSIISKNEGPKEQSLRLKAQALKGETSLRNINANAKQLSRNQLMQKNLSSSLNAMPLAASLDKRLMNKLIGDASKFNQKLYSKKEQLQFADEAWKRKNENKKTEIDLKNNMQNSTQQVSSNKIVDKNSLPIPPYKNNKEKQPDSVLQIDPTKLSPQELQQLVDIANNGSDKEKEKATEILKAMMESNKEAPKITSPMVKRSNTTEITKSIEADKQLAADVKPISVDLMSTITKRLISEVYDEKGFEYQKFIETIYNISAAHKTSPVLIPVLNKALGRINRMSMIKLPEELMACFINITLEELYPETFKKK